jgi:hypothetical protein
MPRLPHPRGRRGRAARTRPPSRPKAQPDQSPVDASSILQMEAMGEYRLSAISWRQRCFHFKQEQEKSCMKGVEQFWAYIPRWSGLWGLNCRHHRRALSPNARPVCPDEAEGGGAGGGGKIRRAEEGNSRPLRGTTPASQKRLLASSKV